MPVQISGVIFLDAGDLGRAEVDVAVAPTGKVLGTSVASATSPRYGNYAERTARLQFYWPALARCTPVQGICRFVMDTVAH
jgi:hypothetical protein